MTSEAVAHQAPLSMGFPWKGYWNGLPFPSPGDLSDSGIKLKSPAWQPDSLWLSSQGISGINIPAIIQAFKWLWTHQSYFFSFVIFLLTPRFPSAGHPPRIPQEAWWFGAVTPVSDQIGPQSPVLPLAFLSRKDRQPKSINFPSEGVEVKWVNDTSFN